MLPPSTVHMLEANLINQNGMSDTSHICNTWLGETCKKGGIKDLNDVSFNKARDTFQLDLLA